MSRLTRIIDYIPVYVFVVVVDQYISVCDGN